MLRRGPDPRQPTRLGAPEDKRGTGVDAGNSDRRCLSVYRRTIVGRTDLVAGCGGSISIATPRDQGAGHGQSARFGLPDADRMRAGRRFASGKKGRGSCAPERSGTSSRGLSPGRGSTRKSSRTRDRIGMFMCGDPCGRCDDYGIGAARHRPCWWRLALHVCDLP